MKVILDTNIWLDWLLFNDVSAQGLKALHAAGCFSLVATDSMKSELADVLGRPHIGEKFMTRSGFASVEQLLQQFDHLTNFVAAPTTNTAWPKCKDREDQIFIDLVIALNIHAPMSAVLVSKDRLVLAMAKTLRLKFGSMVLSPAAASNYLETLRV